MANSFVGRFFCDVAVSKVIWSDKIPFNPNLQADQETESMHIDFFDEFEPDFVISNGGDPKLVSSLPRGRVCYRAEDKKFTIHLGGYKQEAMTKFVIAEFNLPPSETEIVIEDDYKFTPPNEKSLSQDEKDEWIQFAFDEIKDIHQRNLHNFQSKTRQEQMDLILDSIQGRSYFNCAVSPSVREIYSIRDAAAKKADEYNYLNKS